MIRLNRRSGLECGPYPKDSHHQYGQFDKVAGETPKDSQISSAGIPASSCRKAAVICAWLNSGARIGATPHYRFRFRRRTVRNALTQKLVVSLRTSNLRTRASARRISWNGSKIPDEDQLLAKGFRAAWSLLSQPRLASQYGR